MNKDIPSLTSLRFFAALYVFFFHIQIRWNLFAVVFLKNIILQGATGMSLFFLLSGFILAHTYYGKFPHISFQQFIIKRIARIYPAYLWACVASAWMVDFSGLGVFKTILLILANVFLINAWFPQLFAHWNDGATWSLSCEMFFYILFPLFSIWLISFEHRRLIILGIMIYLFTLLPGIYQVAFLSDKIPGVIYYSLPIFRLPEFLLGIIVGIICKKIVVMNTAWLKLWCLFSLLVYILMCQINLLSGNSIYVTYNFIAVPMYLLLIIVCYTSNMIGGMKLLSSKFFKYLGKISYSFYLMQIIPIVMAEKYFPQWHINLTVNMIFTFVIVSNLILAILVYELIEKPMRGIVVRIALKVN